MAFPTEEEQARRCDHIYRSVFADSPNAYLVLTPEFKIINGNDAYMAVMEKDRDNLVNQYVLDVFPNNPDDPHNGVANLTASLERVVRERRRDVMPIQRYDICVKGVWRKCFWYAAAWPLLDEDDGHVVAVIQHARAIRVPDQTDQIIEQTHQLIETSKSLADKLQATLDSIKAL